MKEKAIEQKLIAEVKRHGGICPKFISPGMDGMPDRLILLPGGQLAFAELKAPGKKPRPLQAARHELLRHMGFMVYVLDCPDQVKQLITEMGGDAL